MCVALAGIGTLFAAPGCDDGGDADPSAPPASDAASETDAPSGDYDSYVAGLEKRGEHFTLRLIESLPVPKDTGKYTWVVAVEDPSGTVLSDATVVAEPTMPSHGHGTFPPTTEASPGEEAGHYRLEEMDLFMPGVWQLEISVSHDGKNEVLIYRFDLEG